MLRLMYGSEADIYLNLDSDEIATIPNSVGSRQGCSLGSFLFCLALQPVINQLQAEFPDLLILAYCDDVMICGEASRAIKALERYGQLLHTVIQMELRPDKTTIYSQIIHGHSDIVRIRELWNSSSYGLLLRSGMKYHRWSENLS